MSTHSNKLTPWISRLLLVAVAGAGCSTEPQIGESELAATAGYRARIRRGVLEITGTDADSRLALRLQTSTILDVDVGDDGSADFSFDLSKFSRIVIDAGGGDDFVRMDESNGAFTQNVPVTIIGGAGNDTLIGGIGAETFFGGPGNDIIIGGRGDDVVFMGDGDDTFIWNPGDGNDIVEGEGGTDTMIFSGASVGEHIGLSANGSRLRFTRDIANIVMDLDGVERVEFDARGGADTVTVNDLTGTAVQRVNVDLAAIPGSGTGDGLADTVVVVA